MKPKTKREASMKIIIADHNPATAAQMQAAFDGVPEVAVMCCSILSVETEAFVSPANSFGFMDGGVDFAYSQKFGWQLQRRVQEEIGHFAFGELLVGQAIAVKCDETTSGPYMIVAPTMRVPKLIHDPADVMLATRAAIRCAVSHGFACVALPGMGTGCGMVDPAVSALAMKAGIRAVLYPPLSRPASWREAQTRHATLAA